MRPGWAPDGPGSAQVLPQASFWYPLGSLFGCRALRVAPCENLIINGVAATFCGSRRGPGRALGEACVRMVGGTRFGCVFGKPRGDKWCPRGGPGGPKAVQMPPRGHPKIIKKPTLGPQGVQSTPRSSRRYPPGGKMTPKWCRICAMRGAPRMKISR